MIEQIFRNSYMKYFFARTVSKLAQFTPLSSINIPSKWEFLIISGKFLPLYCASIYKSYLLILSVSFGVASEPLVVCTFKMCFGILHACKIIHKYLRIVKTLLLSFVFPGSLVLWYFSLSVKSPEISKRLCFGSPVLCIIYRKLCSNLSNKLIDSLAQGTLDIIWAVSLIVFKYKS